jgi:hypothetical protein
MKVFLGGTVNGSFWRDEFKEKLTIDYFDPVVEDWNDAAYERELSERRFCDYVLYVLTPKMTGYYAVAEVVDDSYHRPDRTIYCYLPEDDGEVFSAHRIKEFEQLGKTVKENGGTWLRNLEEVISFLNSPAKTKTIKEVYYDGFVSFGRQESHGFAHSIANRLNESGLNFFIDLNDIPLIIDNKEHIYSAILKSDNFIYIISPNAIRSEYCKKELDFAIKNKKRIIPISHIVPKEGQKQVDLLVANKKIIKSNKGLDIDSVVNRVKEKINTDREYVRKHTLYLSQARKWKYLGENQSNLLFGEERKNAIEWLKSSSAELFPLKDHVDFINASRNISLVMLPLLWLNKTTKPFTSNTWFDKVTLVISLGNPIALSITLFDMLSKDESKQSDVAFLSMWSLFIFLQLTSMFIGIKTKNLGLFISMILSIIVCSLVIALKISNPL